MVVLETHLHTIALKDIKNLVRFCNVPKYYTLEEDIVVEFELSPQLKVSAWDWIAVFKEDWNTYESYLVFEWGFGRSCENRRRNIKFAHKYFAKNALLNTNYQFVYISKHLEVLGVSSCFRFELPLSHSKAPRVSRLVSLQGKEIKEKELVSCQLHKNSLVSNVITSCYQCKNLLIHGSLQKTNKDDGWKNKYLELCKKIEDLECILDVLITQYGVTVGKQLDECNGGKSKVEYCRDRKYCDTASETEQPQLVNKVINALPDGYEEVLCKTSSETDESLMLKAIIGHQEEKIRELTNIINQYKLQNKSRQPVVEQDVIRVVKAEERMLAQILRINNNTEEYSNQDDLKKTEV